MRTCHLICVITACITATPLLSADVENHAPKAKITANSEYSGQYLVKFITDGAVPGAASKKDQGKSWAVNGKTHSKGAELTFQWTKPVKVGEIVYFGRTGWFINECFKGCEVYIDGADKPAVKIDLKAMHGPQRIKLNKAVDATKVRMVFTSSHGGFNPGASEIQVYPSSPSDKQLKKFFSAATVTKSAKPAAPQIQESEELKKSLLAGDLGFKKIVVIKRHMMNPTHVYTYHAEGLKPGGGLYVVNLEKGGEVKQIVDSSQGQIIDGNISFDGKVYLFSWKKTMSAKFQIYSINVDGSGLNQVTDHDSNNFNCCWLPDGGVAFLSDRKPAFAYCWITSTPILYRCDINGKKLIRLSANYLNDFTPAVMEDGRILYSRWEYVDRPAIPIQSLWTVNQDGTGLAGFFGNRVLSPATFMEAREIPGSRGKVLCVLTSHNGPCRGAIGIVDPSIGGNAQEAITNLTPEINIGLVDKGAGNRVRGPYESPFPIDNKHYLCSKMGTILLRDYAGKQQAVVLAKNDNLGWYTARPVMGRKRPDVQNSILKEGGDQASLLMRNVYNGLDGKIKKGKIVKLAVVQEMEKSKLAHVKVRAFGFQFPVVSCGATYAPKKVWGYVKVQEDGSAHFKVPSGLPIYFMALDKHGRALQRMRSFTHLMPGEKQSCVGCHADRNYAVPLSTGKPPIASRMKPQELEKPEWGVKGFSYIRIVQPVLDKHCMKCHGAKKKSGGVDLSGDRTEFFCVSYETLARAGTGAENWQAGGHSRSRFGKSPYTSWIPTYNGLEYSILHVEPKQWGSPASKLAEIIMNGHPKKDGKKRIDLTPEEKFRLFQWMDLNVPYYGTSISNYNNLRGCRRIYPADLDNVLKDVAKRRCVSCHKKSIPRKFYTRITKVENNPFLLAPLSKSAGGTEACGKEIFVSKDDLDYKKILKTFEATTKMLTKKPRMDME